MLLKVNAEAEKNFPFICVFYLHFMPFSKFVDFHLTLTVLTKNGENQGLHLYKPYVKGKSHILIGHCYSVGLYICIMVSFLFKEFVSFTLLVPEGGGDSV
jgi:hypothetical protein